MTLSYGEAYLLVSVFGILAMIVWGLWVGWLLKKHNVQFSIPIRIIAKKGGEEDSRYK